MRSLTARAPRREPDALAFSWDPSKVPNADAFIRALPKAELHLHLEGSMTLELLERLCLRQNRVLPDEAALLRTTRGARRFSTFREFIRLYLAMSDCIREPEDLIEVIEDLGGRLAGQGVRRAEVTMTPWTHVRRGASVQGLIGGLVEGRVRVAERFGVDLGWVFDIVRLFPDQATPTLEFALQVEAADSGSVVGLGLAGPEDEAPDVEPFVEVFERARSAGLWALPHAGEVGDPARVRAAVERLGATRIGHGIASVRDPRVVELLVERDVALEVCPSSNVGLGAVPSWKDHPINRLIDAGVCVCLGTDDPPLFDTDGCEEYRRGVEHFGWTLETVRTLVKNSIRRARVCPEDRDTLLSDADAV